jgi:hypothetical protein
VSPVAEVAVAVASPLSLDAPPGPLVAVPVAVLVDVAAPELPPRAAADELAAPVLPEVADPVAVAVAAPLAPPEALPVTLPVDPEVAVTPMLPVPPPPDASPVSPVST